MKGLFRITVAVYFRSQQSQTSIWKSEGDP